MSLEGRALLAKGSLAVVACKCDWQKGKHSMCHRLPNSVRWPRIVGRAQSAESARLGVSFCTAALMCMVTIQRRVPSCQASLKDAGEVMRWPYRVCSMWSTGGVSRRSLCGASVAIFGSGRGYASPLGGTASES